MFVCDNLAFSGEIEIRTRQTLNIAQRIPGLMSDAIARILSMAEHQQARFDAYRNVELKPCWGDALLVDMVRHGALVRRPSLAAPSPSGTTPAMTSMRSRDMPLVAPAQCRDRGHQACEPGACRCARYMGAHPHHDGHSG